MDHQGLTKINVRLAERRNSGNMPSIMFRCIATGVNTHAWIADDIHASADENDYVLIPVLLVGETIWFMFKPVGLGEPICRPNHRPNSRPQLFAHLGVESRSPLASRLDQNGLTWIKKEISQTMFYFPSGGYRESQGAAAANVAWGRGSPFLQTILA
jgi:hypothetical protein